MSNQATRIEDIPERIRDTLVEEYGDSQDRCVRGYVPTQSIIQVMDYLDADNIQRVKGRRVVKDSAESFKVSHNLPAYVETEEQLKREMILDFDRAKHNGFEWSRIVDFLADSDLEDIAINKLVLRMENEDLKDHLFTLLQNAINYPSSYKSEFTDPFYFVMESRAAEEKKDYENIKNAHEQGYLEELGWKYRCLDLMGIWSHYGWVKSGNEPFATTTQHEVEELAFNQRKTDKPVFGAVNSPLVVNHWRTPFGRGLTDMRHYEWREQQGWVRSE